MSSSATATGPARAGEATAPRLRIADLHAGYGKSEVLHGVCLDVAAGSVTVLLGANGAGKTTLMRALTGSLRSVGEIEIDGQPIPRHAPHRIRHAGVSLVPQGRGTFNEMSVMDNLRLGALLLPKGERAHAIEEWLTRLPRLAERQRVNAGMLSGGEQQMLAIARACIARPRLLLCDEPSLGLSPALSHDVFGVFRELSQTRNLSMLIVEQNANLALSVADSAYLLDTGSISWQGTPEELREDDAIARAFLGEQGADS